MLKDALKIAKTNGHCFYLNFSFDDEKPYGYIWYYAHEDSTNVLFFKEYTKKGVIEKFLPYDKDFDWVGRFNENKNLTELNVFVYGGVLDGGTLYYIHDDDGRCYCELIIARFKGVIENPGKDVFFDNLVQDIVSYELLPI